MEGAGATPPLFMTTYSLLAGAAVVAIGGLFGLHFERKLHRREVEMATSEVDADAKAMSLLYHVLGDAEFSLFRQRGYIQVRGTKYPQYTYQIAGSAHGVVVVNRHGAVVMNLCIFCLDDRRVGSGTLVRPFPIGDQLVTLVMMCKYQEDRLFRVANSV